MPRRRKTYSGEAAQRVESVPGQRYGEGVQQAALQRSMPAPDLQASTPAASPAGAVAPVAAPTPGAAWAAQLAAARSTAGAGLMNALTGRPSEPVTAGLPLGPGPGPEMLRPIAQTSTRMFFEQVSRLTGNPYLAELGRRVAP